MVTVSPLNRLPFGGVWLTTDPDGTVSLLTWSPSLTVRPASESALFAWSAGLPVKSVTAIGWRPLLTVTATAAPGLREVPAVGSCAMTCPAWTVSLNASVRSPSTRCCAVRVAATASPGVPTSVGAA